MLSQVDRPAHHIGASAPAASSDAPRRKSAARVVLLAAAGLALAATGSANAAPKSKPNQVRYEYVSPKNPAHQSIHDQMKQGRALEHLQELLAPLRLPYPLTLKVAGCDGIINAWYNDEVITVCYELLANMLKNAPAQDLPVGISRADTVLGPVLDTFLREPGIGVSTCCRFPCSAARKMPPISSQPTSCSGSARTRPGA